MRLQKTIISIIIIIAAFMMRASNCKAARSTTPEMEKELQARVKEIFDARALAIITNADPGPALADYDTTARLGRWGLSHEQAKLNYIQLWAKKRGVRITVAESSICIPWSRVGEDTAEFVVHQTLQLGYIYPDDPTVNRFGTGTRHWMELVRKDEKWVIRQDFYTDGIGDDSLAPNPEPADGAAMVEPIEKSASTQNVPPDAYDREGVVRYADKYAGLAWGTGNNHQYNPRYRNLNDRGGDCTNFVSQCLGDAEGGKLHMDGIWYYAQEDNSGSQAWVRAESFGDWLLYSGYGRRVARGTFPELNQPGAGFPRGAVRELQKGDVIGYGERGYSEHMSIVVGCDSKGYPLVNAHTVDRYHCPWDMGNDKTTVFHLYQIHDQ